MLHTKTLSSGSSATRGTVGDSLMVGTKKEANSAGIDTAISIGWIVFSHGPAKIHYIPLTTEDQGMPAGNFPSNATSKFMFEGSVACG